MKTKPVRHTMRLLPRLLLAAALISAFAGCRQKDRSMKMNEPRNIHGVANFSRTFGDLNRKQLDAARAIGIRPVASREEAEGMKGRLTRIQSNENYAVDTLTHSIPYLVPKAAALLNTVGQNFLDSLASKGLNPNRIIVTSVLRTGKDVTKAEIRPEQSETLHPCLRNDLRCQLEAFPKGGRQRRTSAARCRSRHAEARACRGTSRPAPSRPLLCEI